MYVLVNNENKYYIIYLNVGLIILPDVDVKKLKKKRVLFNYFN